MVARLMFLCVLSMALEMNLVVMVTPRLPAESPRMSLTRVRRLMGSCEWGGGGGIDVMAAR